MTHKIVIDTNVLVSALLSKRGASYRLIMAVGTGAFDIAVSVPLVLEYEDAAKRVIPPVEHQVVDDVVDYLCEHGSKRRVFYLWRPILNDTGDDLVLEVAVEAGCNSIVTYNTKHFLKTEQFGIKTETPKEFLTRLELL